MKLSETHQQLQKEKWRKFFFALTVSLLLWPSLSRAGDYNIVAWGDNSWGETNIPSGLTAPVAIAAADDQSLVLQSNGIPAQWGEITADPRWSVPADLTNAIAIASGADPFNLALTDKGTVRGWGGNDYGCSTVPAGLSNVVAIAAGYEHSLALKSDGAVVAWGDNTFGQTNVPSWLSNVVAIAAGEFQSLALRSDGTVVGWGDNVNGESTGTPTSSPYITNGVVTIQGNVLSNVVAIAAGVGYFSLGLKTDGTVVQWGVSYMQQPPSNLGKVVAIAAGGHFALGLKGDGTVVAWGNSLYGATSVPLGLSNVVAIAAGLDHGIALVGNGASTTVPILTNPYKDTNGFHAIVSTRSGHVYALEYKNSLSDVGWTAIPLVVGNGGIITLTDPTANIAQRFYRVHSW